MKNHICPVGAAATLDNRIRSWLQNPRKIVGPYLRPGLTALDVGCGPGFFALAMAEMVGPSGRVIAADLQEGMLRKLAAKLRGTQLEKRVVLHKSAADHIGVSEPIDFMLAFYMVHEVRDQKGFFDEAASILKADGRVLVAEPPLHVSKKAFGETIHKAGAAGLYPLQWPKMVFSKAVLLGKG